MTAILLALAAVAAVIQWVRTAPEIPDANAGDQAEINPYAR